MQGQSTRPIFIVGAPRSGTTLLQYMLRSHPRISIPTGESHFFIPLYRQRESFGDLSCPENIQRVLEEMQRRSQSFVETDLHGVKFDIPALTKTFLEEGRTTIESIIAGLFEKNAAGEGKARWGDKTPYYVLQIPTILEMFPNAQFIHLVRDGRDCALSMFRRKRDFSVYNIYFAAKYWQQYVEVGREHGHRLDKMTYLEIKYESLLNNPKLIMEEVSHFLGEEFSESLVHFKKSGEAGKTPLLQQPIQSQNVNKWEVELSPMQLKIFERAAGKTLESFGYKLKYLPATLPLVIRGGFRLHNLLMKWWFSKIWKKRVRKLKN